MNATTTTNGDTRPKRNGRRAMGFALAGLTVAGAGLIAVPAVAGAQDGDDTAAGTEASHGPGAVLDDLVVDGVISQDQADAIEEAFVAHRMEAREARGAFDLEVITGLLGLSGEEIHEALVGGQTLADLAVEQGVAVDDLVDAIVTERQSMIDEKVEAGVLTEEQAAEISEGLVDRVTARVNGERPEGAPQGGPGFGRRGRFGPPPVGADGGAPVTDAAFA
jgi:polyhydroxyalkanoate synthesis regulator phasin